jgi:hypothetical protein
MRLAQVGGSLWVVLAFSGAAFAGPPEELTSLAFHPSNPDVMALRFVQGGDGLFVTRDGGESWGLLCRAPIDPTTTYLNVLAISGDGTTILAGEGNDSGRVYNGLWEDDGTSCTWTRGSGVFERWVTDLAVHPTEPSTVLGITSDGAPTSENGVWRRTMDGTWAPLGTQEPMIISRLRAAATSSGVRLYQSASKGTHDPPDGSAIGDPKFLIRVSDDEGATWQEHPYPITDGNLRMVAIDPTNPDRIVAVDTRREVPTHPPEMDFDQVMVSSDRGATFTLYLEVAELGGVALAPDGRVWIGDRGSTLLRDVPRGLWYAPSLDEVPEKIADYPVACLGFQPEGGTLFACQWTAFGKVGSDGSFESLLDFVTADALLACPGRDMAQVCELQLCAAYCGLGHFPQAPMCEVYDSPVCGPCVVDRTLPGCRSAPEPIDTPPDASMTDASTTDAAPPGDGGGGGSGCSCEAAPGSGDSSATRLSLALAVLGACISRRAGRATSV